MRRRSVPFRNRLWYRRLRWWFAREDGPWPTDHIKDIRRPSPLRQLWVRWRHNNCCPCAHSHNETADSCWFCHWCQEASS